MNLNHSESSVRGKITNRERAKQIIDFSGLKWGNITPTNIDGSLDFMHGKVFIKLELKLKGKKMDPGQRMHYAYGCDDHKSPCLVVVADHEVYDPEVDIPAAECVVTEYYTNHGDMKGEWRSPEIEGIKCRAFIDDFFCKVWVYYRQHTLTA